MRVALTGTPGVGKTTVARKAAKRGWTVIDVRLWAHEHGAVVARDEADQADVIDIDLLAAHVQSDDGAKVLFEGHLSHQLPLDAVCVIRCDPRILKDRLLARAYAWAKVEENLEAEALDIILQEALDSGMPVIQRDGTRRRPGALWKSFAEALSGDLKNHDLEHVDWSDRLP